MKDLEIPINFSWIKSQSKSGFKGFVNKQSKIYTFNYLRDKQQSYSKLRNLKYSDLKTQLYLRSNFSNEIMRNIFLFRTRMSPFCENFRGSRKETQCPFKCENEKDDQIHFFKCQEMKKYIQINLSYDDFLEENICEEKIIQLHKMLTIRGQLIEKNCQDFKLYG